MQATAKFGEDLSAVLHPSLRFEWPENRFGSVIVFVPRRRRWLVCDQALPMRSPLAPLLTVPRPFCERRRKFPPSAADYEGVSRSGATLYVPIPSLFGDLLPLKAPGERSERGAFSGRRDRAHDLGTLPAVPRLSRIRRLFMLTARTVTWDELLRLGPAFARMGWP